MSNEDNKILKNNREEEPFKAPVIRYADLECLIDKCIYVKIILKNVIQRKRLSIHFQIAHCLQIAYLMKQKTNLTVTEVKTVWKDFERA